MHSSEEQGLNWWSTIVALDTSGVSSMTQVLVRSMMTPSTMVSSIALVDASTWTEAMSFFIAATTTSSYAFLFC